MVSAANSYSGSPVAYGAMDGNNQWAKSLFLVVKSLGLGWVLWGCNGVAGHKNTPGALTVNRSISPVKEIPTGLVGKVNRVSERVQPLKDVTPTLGQGFCPDTQMASELNCFSHLASYKGGTPDSTVRLDGVVHFEEVQESLGLYVTSDVSIGPFSFSESMNYLDAIKTEGYSEAFHYYEKYFGPSNKLNISKIGMHLLTPDVGQVYYNQSRENFRIVCGSELITESHPGVSVYFSLKVNLNTWEEREIFKISMGASWGNIADVSAKAQKIVNDKGLRGTVEIFAYQIGGDPSRLAQIFGKDPDGRYCVSRCAFGSWDDCGQLVDGVLDYAKGLSNQTGINSTPLGYEVTDLNKLNLPLTPRTDNATVVAARKQLADALFDRQRRYNVISHVVQQPDMQPYIPFSISEALSATLQNLSQAISMLTDPDTGGTVCYTSPLQCPAFAENLLNSLPQFNASLVDQFMTGYQMKSTVTGNSCSEAGQELGYLCPDGTGNYVYFFNGGGAHPSKWSFTPVNASALRVGRPDTSPPQSACCVATQSYPPPYAEYDCKIGDKDPSGLGQSCLFDLDNNACSIEEWCNGCSGTVKIWPLAHNPC